MRPLFTLTLSSARQPTGVRYACACKQFERSCVAPQFINIIYFYTVDIQETTSQYGQRRTEKQKIFSSSKVSSWCMRSLVIIESNFSNWMSVVAARRSVIVSGAGPSRGAIIVVGRLSCSLVVVCRGALKMVVFVAVSTDQTIRQVFLFTLLYLFGKLCSIRYD